MLKKFILPCIITASLVLLPLVTNAQTTFRPDSSTPLSFTLKAGESATGSTTAVNKIDQPIDVELYATDGTLSSTGSFSVNQKSAVRLDVGKWVHFVNGTLSLKAKEEKEVTFIINIPSDATPGSYKGGVSIEPVLPKIIATAGAGAIVSTRVAMPIYITVSGDKITKYSWDGFSHQFDKKHIFTLDFSNSGNTLLQAKGEITIEDLFGNKTILPIDNLSLPRYSQNPAQTRWDQKPFFGFFTATANLTFSEFDPTTHSFKDIETLSKTLTFNVIPWGFIILVLLIIIAFVTYFVEKNHGFKKLLKSCKEYTVNDNETLAGIAKANDTTWQKLAKINNLTPPYTLNKNQKILIPPKKIT